MEIGTAEISRIIKEQIRDYEKSVEVQEVGTVLSTGDGIARVYGLDKVAAGELLEFPHGIFGVALNLEEDNVGDRAFRRNSHDQRGRHGQAHRQNRRGACRQGIDRTRGQCLGRADRRPWPHRNQGPPPNRD